MTAVHPEPASHSDCALVPCRTCGLGVDLTCLDGPTLHAESYGHDPDPSPADVAWARADTRTRPDPPAIDPCPHGRVVCATCHR